MTNRTLTSLILRFAGLLLFMKIFDHFGTYFISLYMTAIIPIFEEHLDAPFNKYYYNGTFLTIANIVISFFLVFKAELISKWLIKNDTEINIQLTKEDLMKSTLQIIGIIWIAQSIYLLPEGVQFVLQFIDWLSGAEMVDIPTFALMSYLLKTVIALLFIFRVNKISNFFNRKIEKTSI